MQHRSGIVGVHDVGTEPEEERGEPRDERGVWTLASGRVVHGHSARLEANAATRRQRDYRGLVTAIGELVRQLYDQSLLSAYAKPLHDVDDAHRDRRL